MGRELAESDGRLQRPAADDRRLPGFARAANIHGVAVDFSVSITSALARLPGAAKFPALPLALSALVALAALAAAGAIYRRNGVPFLYRPDGQRPDEPTTRAVVALEWAGLLTAALVFSPQTNTRHLCLLLFVNALAALLLLRPRDGVKRWPLLIGTTLLLLGLTLPPGGQDVGEQVGVWSAGPLAVWHGVGGPCWCALAMFGTMLWVGLPLRVACVRKRRSPRPSAAQPDERACIHPVRRNENSSPR